MENNTSRRCGVVLSLTALERIVYASVVLAVITVAVLEVL